MLRVECEACHAPYQVDERRVPPQGLKMRCPKCGHTFTVAGVAGAVTGAGAAPPRPAAPAPPKPTAKAKATMSGLGDAPGAPADEPDLPVARGPLPKAPPVPPRGAVRAPPPSGPSLDAREAPEMDLPAARPAPPRPGVPRPTATGKPVPVAKPPVPVAKPAPPPAPAADLADLPAPRSKMSSLPAALGSLDNLPAAREAPKPAPAPEAFGEIDLPAVAADLPVVGGPALPAVKKAPPRKDDMELDFGPPAADLPAPLPEANLFPQRQAPPELPVVASTLPLVRKEPPPKKVEPAFGEIDLPMLDARTNLPEVASTLPLVANVLPQVGQQLPVAAPPPTKVSGSFEFGEVDLGSLEVPASPSMTDDDSLEVDSANAPLTTRDDPPRPPSPKAATSFGELDLGAADLESLPPPPVPPPRPKSVEVAASKAPTAFGELDLGGSDPPPPFEPEVAVPITDPPPHEASLPPPVSGRPSGAPHATEVTLPAQPRPGRQKDDERKPSVGPRVALVLFLLALLGGGALQLTRHGAFGYLTIGDMVRAKEYQAFADAQSAAARARAAKDTFPDTRGAVDDLVAAHWRMPRARALEAYVAFAEFAYEARFGADAERNAKAKLFVSELVVRNDVPGLGVVLAAQEAAAGNFAGARSGLAGANPGDPWQREIALLRGEVELGAKDPKAAKTAFDAAVKLGATTEAHYGLARVAAAARDWTTASTESEATLAAMPHHPGALLLRARQRYEEKGDDTGALADLKDVIEGQGKPLASVLEVAQAFANRGLILLASGRAGDARSAFEAALKLDPRNVDALIGQGTVFFQESRFTEALTRFDTALGARPDDENAIAYDALTKIKLERLRDAKDQLVAARARFPKSMRLAFGLAQTEAALGNTQDAEKDLRLAIDLASPKDPASVEPSIALARLLIAHARDKEAEQVIADAKAKLPDEAPVAVAFGEYDAAQGKYDDAVAQFQHALERSASSLSTHFKLGVVYRHMRKTDLATQEFDRVLAIDKEYPGLALERGLLFEDSGEVDQALEQFKTALARAPDDPDLQLRIGAAYVAIGRADDALPMLRKVLEKRGASAEANHYLGRALFARDGATNEAMRYLKRAVDLDPNRAEYHLYVAWAANDASPAQLGLAQEEIDKALAADKLLADAYWQRGVLERKRLAVEDALKDLTYALALKPTRVDAYATIAECYEDKNDPTTALANWQKAIAGNARNAYWRFRYGKLALDHGISGEAATNLSYAVDEGGKQDPHPPWLPPAEFAAAEALNRTGRRSDSIAMYRRFLEIAPMNDPDRRDALKALENMGEHYGPGGH